MATAVCGVSYFLLKLNYTAQQVDISLQVTTTRTRFYLML